MPVIPAGSAVVIGANAAVQKTMTFQACFFFVALFSFSLCLFQPNKPKQTTHTHTHTHTLTYTEASTSPSPQSLLSLRLRLPQPTSSRRASAQDFAPGKVNRAISATMGVGGKGQTMARVFQKLAPEAATVGRGLQRVGVTRSLAASAGVCVTHNTHTHMACASLAPHRIALSSVDTPFVVFYISSRRCRSCAPQSPATLVLSSACSSPSTSHFFASL